MSRDRVRAIAERILLGGLGDMECEAFHELAMGYITLDDMDFGECEMCGKTARLINVPGSMGLFDGQYCSIKCVHDYVATK